MSEKRGEEGGHVSDENYVRYGRHIFSCFVWNQIRLFWRDACFPFRGCRLCERLSRAFRGRETSFILAIQNLCLANGG